MRTETGRSLGMEENEARGDFFTEGGDGAARPPRPAPGKSGSQMIFNVTRVTAIAFSSTPVETIQHMATTLNFIGPFLAIARFLHWIASLFHGFPISRPRFIGWIFVIRLLVYAGSCGNILTRRLPPGSNNRLICFAAIGRRENLEFLPTTTTYHSAEGLPCVVKDRIPVGNTP